MTDFDIALNAFINAINKGFEELAKEFDGFTYGRITYGTSDSDFFKPVVVMTGPKKVRIIQRGKVYCFVDKATGDILKAAGQYSAAKGSRGNIYKPETYNKAQTLGTNGWLYAR